MSMKLKALGLGLLAAMAMSAIAVVNASATASGHFGSAEAHTLIVGTENATHKVRLSIDHGNTIECDKASYSGTTVNKTETQITITPTYQECHTTGETFAERPVNVTMNGCDYTFFSQGNRKHGTATVNCATGKAIEIHHPSCTVTVGTQHALTNGISYENEAGTLTANVTVGGIAAEYHGGVCIFLGTGGHEGTMNGSATIAGTNTAGGAVAISST